MLNQHYLNRYQKFISTRPNRTKRRNDGLEKHHIIPKAISPGLAKDANNIVVLTPREHYLAHWMLAKIYGGKMWFAFNQMRRVIVGDKKTSFLYEKSRKYISEQIKIANTGIVRSEELRQQWSNIRKGKLVVTDGERNFAVHVEDPRYVSGDLVSVNFGRTHTEDTKEKMSRNGILGKVCITDGNVTKMVAPSSEIPEGWWYGREDSFKLKTQHDSRIFYHNPLTGEQTRISPNDIIPEGFEKGRVRGTENGAAVMNNPDCAKVFCLKSKKIILVNRIDEKKEYEFNTPANGYVVKYKNYLFENLSTFNTLMWDFPKLSTTSIDKKFKPNHSTTMERNEFLFAAEGLTWRDIGVDIVKIIHYNWNDNETIVKGDLKYGHVVDDIKRALRIEIRLRKEALIA